MPGFQRERQDERVRVIPAFPQHHGFREALSDLLPHSPSSPNAFTPSDTALGLLGGIISGADKLSRVAWLASDPAVAEVLGIEAIPSQSTLTRFLGVFSQCTSTELGKLHAWAASKLPSRKGGYTLDMDSWSLLHEDIRRASRWAAPEMTPSPVIGLWWRS